MKPSIMRSLLKSILALYCALVLCACATSTQKEIAQKEAVAKLHYQIGLDALHKRNLPKAFDELMISNAANPNQAHVLDALAYAWLLRGDLKKSETHYRKSLRIKAQASTQNNYASLLNKMGRHKEAEAMARKALEDPRYRRQNLAFINLGDALLGQNKLDEAIHSYGQAQIFNSNDILPQLRIANAYMQYGHLRKARASYKKLMLKHGSNRIVIMGLLQVLKKQNDLEEARRIIAQFTRHATSTQDKEWAREELEKLR